MSLISQLRNLLTCCGLSYLLLPTPHLLAQQQPKGFTIRETFEPTFQIEPLVQRLNGRRGDVLRFEFQVQATNKDTEVDVALVDLRQEITGQVVHDQATEINGNIQLLNPGRAKLQRNIPLKIQGIVRVPQGDASFYSYGVLVRDIGNAPPPPPKIDANGKPLTNAGIRFITQYVLRVDLEVEGARGDNVAELSIEDGKLSTSRGLPKVSVIIRNPSDTAFEYEIKSRLKSNRGLTLKPVRMTMPVRASMETEDRYLGRVLPKSAVRMEELVPEPILTGQYQMEVDLLMHGRIVKQRTFTVNADSEDFPAQQALLSRTGEDLYAAPVYLELSQLRGGQRRLTMEFSNISDHPREIQLQSETLRGTPMANVIIQPESFVLAPKSKRKISIQMRSNKEAAEPIEYGHIVVKNKSGNRDFSETGRMPIALHFAATSDADLELQALRWVPNDRYDCFKAKVINNGKYHTPLDAQLTIESESGQRLRIPSGFGRWIMPGQEVDLEFRPDNALPPGNYRLITELQNGQNPIIKMQQFVVSDVAQPRSESTKP